MRHTSNLDLPVLDLPWKYQHHYQLTEYLRRRDQYAPTNSFRWRSTAIDFASQIHPIPACYSGSFWKAARRTSILYDWMGHGYNHFKRGRHKTKQSPVPQDTIIPCKHCGQHDDQAHIMLLCTNPLLTPIRITARVQQARIAAELQRESTSPIERHFIDQLTLASWLSASPTTARIWTGMWTQDTLTALFPVHHDMHSPMCKADRYKYRKVAKMLSQPLIAAYKKMVCIGTPAPMTTASQHRYRISNKTKHHTSLLFQQQAQATTHNDLTHLHMSTNNSCTAYSYSDAAFRLTDVETGTIINNV